jgi:hypothetical protein
MRNLKMVPLGPVYVHFLQIWGGVQLYRERGFEVALTCNSFFLFLIRVRVRVSQRH